MTPCPAAILGPLLAASLACASGRTGWEEVRVPEVHLETLPTGAEVDVDGAPAGRSPLSFPVREPMRTYRIRARVAGFEPLEVAIEGDRLAGGRLDLVLRPAGFGSQRRLDLGEPAGLAQAAMALLRAGKPREALAFADASLAVGETPLAHKAAGEAHRKLGNQNRAVQHYSAYVDLVPDAPDRKQIEDAIAAVRGDVTVSPPR